MGIDLKKYDKARNRSVVTNRIPGYRFWIPIASFMGTGYAPRASGTVGSFVTFFLLFMIGLKWPDFASGIPYIVACLLIIPIGAIASDKGRKMWGDDASRIVIDETAGMMWSVLFFGFSPFAFIGLFFLFRFFDIFKLPPGRQIDKNIHSGWGILLDDIIAGIYANLTMRLVIFTLTYIGCCERLVSR